MAGFVEAVFTAGAVYATVTVFPLPIAEARVRTIDRIPSVLKTEDLATEETTTGFPSERTVKADAEAVVVLTVSS